MMLLLDASAILAYLHAEPGWEAVEPVILDRQAAVCPANLAEVVGKLCDEGLEPASAIEAVGVLGLQVTPFGEREALLAGSLRQQTRALGLSLGDRACLATAGVLSLPVLTADRPWLRVASILGLDIRCIRPDTH